MNDGDGLRARPVPVTAIAGLAAELVAVRSQGGIDTPDAILDRMAQFLRSLGLAPNPLSDGNNRHVALACKIAGRTTGRTLCFNACLDTAPFGDLGSWSFAPTDASIVEGRLRGRGAADSKMGAAILAHVGAFMAACAREWAGTLHLLFDADEHSGQFGGVQRFAEAAFPRPQGVVLGYPGHGALMVGARGFFRVTVTVFGTSAHTGSRNRIGINAIAKLARFISRIELAPLPEAKGSFPPPALSVTNVEGGSGYSQTPDKASCGIDIRTTPAFDVVQARTWLEEQIRTFDATESDRRPSNLSLIGSWPAYALDAQSRLVRAFLAAGCQAFGHTIGTDICGPSNIGNYLATQGIETICGLGVGYDNLHGADETADVADIEASFRAYLEGALAFLAENDLLSSQA